MHEENRKCMPVDELVAKLTASMRAGWHIFGYLSSSRVKFMSAGSEKSQPVHADRARIINRSSFIFLGSD